MRTWLTKLSLPFLFCWFSSSLFLVPSAFAQVLKHQNQADVLQFIESHQPTVVHKTQHLAFKDLISKLDNKQVVFVGETHDRYGHHLNQLAVLRSMYQQNKRLGIGVEWFQQQTQPILDAYLSGRISEAKMLQQTRYYERWRYDYRLIRPILEFAKQHRIPIIALNAPSHITHKVARQGIASLTPTERKQLPSKIHPPHPSYLKRLQRVFSQHGKHANKKRFHNFALVQRIWDETMAMNIQRFLKNNPKHRMIVFSGSGHIINKSGIPNDVSRNLPKAPITTIVSSSLRDITPKQADYFLVNRKPYSLPRSARLGVWLDTTPDSVIISRLKRAGTAHRQGLKAGDRIIFINNAAIHTLSDLRIQLLNYTPKEEVIITVERINKQTGDVKIIAFKFKLQ